MNEEHEPLHKAVDDVATPLDAFEDAWTSQLAIPDPDLAESADAFVEATLARHAQGAAPTKMESSDAPGVLARIGWVPLAAAAAIAVAGGVGLALMPPGGVPQGPAVADNHNDAGDQPAVAVTPVVATREDAQRLQLGALIGQASGSFTQPTASLPQTIEDTTGRLTLRSLVKDLVNPIPDPKDFLPPRDSAAGNS